MTKIAAILGIASGVILVGSHQSPANLIATSLAVDASLAPLTAVIASRRGHSATLWAVVGFGLGAWGLAWILLFGGRRAAPENRDYPPTSDAA
jgi:hypothetical protein